MTEIDRSAYEALFEKIRSKRARNALRHILDHGSVSTEVLRQMGYHHPPRAAQDLKELGVRLRTVNSKHPVTGNRMGNYLLDAPRPIDNMSFRGRGALPKRFKQNLFQHYGTRCNLDAYAHSRRSLQADHRIPYVIAGDPEGFDINDWQLLCASHQRSKSYECERCPNLELKHVDTCRTCFWAYPEHFTHVAMREQWRTEVVTDDLALGQAITQYARSRGLTVQEATEELLRRGADSL